MRGFHLPAGYIKNKNVSAVHIVRKNILAVLVSRKVNKIFETAHTKEKIVTPQVEIDTNNLLRSIQRLESENAKCESELSSIPYLKIFYEDFVKDKEQGLNQITDFLGVPSCSDLQPQTTKLNPTNLKKSIQNYEEVAKALKGTTYETYL